MLGRSPGLATGAAALIAWSASLVMGSGGCTRILGIDYTYQGTGGGGAVTTTVTQSSGAGGAMDCGTRIWDDLPTCQSCTEASCCAELKACDQGTPCGDLLACADSCAPDDTACKQACIDADSSAAQDAGLYDFTTLLYCFSDHCSLTDACAIPICQSTFTWNERGCADCLGTDPTCCAAFTDCAKDPLCTACTQNPTGAGCDMSALFQATLTCETMTCAKECSFVICGSGIGYTINGCNYCVSQPMAAGCCAEYDACVADMGCYDCLSGATTTGCSTNTVYGAYNSCVINKCDVACTGL